MKKNKYKEFFDDLLIENDKKEKIYFNIVNKKNNKFNFKLAYVMPIFIFSLFVGIVFADEIKSTFNTLIVKHVEKENDNGEKYDTIIYKSGSLAEINYNADLPIVDNSTDYNYYTINEIENKLGISFLKSDLIKNKNIAQLTTIKKDNKISFAVFKIFNAYNEIPLYENESETQYGKESVICDIVISLKTKYSTNEKLEEWSSGSKVVSISEKYVKSLDTTVLIKKHEGLDSLREVLFDYDNIRYSISLTIPYGLDSDTELNKFLESLHI